MSAIIPNEGEARLLLELLDNGSPGTTREAWTLRLYQSPTTPNSESDVVSTYSVADFLNYTDKTLTRSVVNLSTWNNISQVTPTGGWSAEPSVAESTYQQQSWTNGGAAQTIYGYIIFGASSNKLIMAEKFAASRTLNPGDQLNFTPRFGVS